VVVDDHTTWLDGVNMVINFPHAPVEICRLIPLSVEPDGPNLSIVCQQLGQLTQHEVVVVLPLTFFGATHAISCPSHGIIIGTTPIEQGIVKVQLDALLVAFISKFLDHIATEWCGIHDIVGRLFCAEHRETIVVA